ncbi:MAG: hypothetical protein WCF90_07185, partial [Methanomicrobiales archaeon]
QGQADEICYHGHCFRGLFPSGNERHLLPGRGENKFAFTAKNGREALPLIAESVSTRGMNVHSLSLHKPTPNNVFLIVVGSSDEPRSFNDTQFRVKLERR